MTLDYIKKFGSLSLHTRMRCELLALSVLRRMGWINSQKIFWKLGISSEIIFWKEYLQTKGSLWKDFYETQLQPDTPLEKIITDLLDAPLGYKVRILDVGAGPLTTLGKIFPGHQVELVAVDALADYYDEILAELDINPIVRTRKAEAERLTEVFEKNSFDLVHARNSIDHCYDPVLAIDEMLAVTRPGGWVLMQHVPNEATEAKEIGYIYAGSGFHQWDFFVENDDFWISGLNARTNITERLAGQATISTEVFKGEGVHGISMGWMICRIHKNPIC
jgi:SAM-dependent methyltransferase